MVRVGVHFGLTILTYTCVNFLHKAALCTTGECRKRRRAGENARQTNWNPARHMTAGISRHHWDIPAYPAGTYNQVLPIWAYSAIWLVSHGLAWPTYATPTPLPCNPYASCCCPTRATWTIRDTLVSIHALSNVSSFVLTAISNENREQPHRTPEATHHKDTRGCHTSNFFCP